MNMMIALLRIKNRISGSLFPGFVARKTARMFLTPKRFPPKPWEKEAESHGRRVGFGNGLSAVRWGESSRKILIMHGWESRATQLYSLVPGLLDQGFEVIGIDAPAHGRSKGGKANPMTFSRAIGEADKAFGPFYGAIGHSMGAAAISIAMESGVRFQRTVLVASPNRLYDMLVAFAGFIGLPKRAQILFVKEIEKEVGRPAEDLDVSRVFSELKPEALLIHAKNDSEVPFACHDAILKACPGLQDYISESLGHRRIVRSPDISERISRFMGLEKTRDTTWCRRPDPVKHKKGECYETGKPPDSDRLSKVPGPDQARHRFPGLAQNPGS